MPLSLQAGWPCNARVALEENAVQWSSIPGIPGLAAPAGALISGGREKPGRTLLPRASAWATSSNFCNLRTANSDAHWADVPTLTRIH